jgi:hypothetical protein
VSFLQGITDEHQETSIPLQIPLATTAKRLLRGHVFCWDEFFCSDFTGKMLGSMAGSFCKKYLRSRGSSMNDRNSSAPCFKYGEE